MVFVLVIAMISVTSSVLLYRDQKNRNKIKELYKLLNSYKNGEEKQAQKIETFQGIKDGNKSNEPPEKPAG
jgi:preprotein translocase subunit YajC